MTSNKRLREGLVNALLLARHSPELVSHKLAGQILDRWDELLAREAALREIKLAQPRTLATLRSHGVVFERDDIGNDPKNWAHVAFTIYTDLCEVDQIAGNALEEQP